LNTLRNAKKPSSFAYQLFCQQATVTPTAQHKWEAEFINQSGVTDIDWSRVYSMPYRCTIETKNHYFQFRFIHRILPTNEFLCKIGINESDKCSFCKKVTETMRHLMWDCHIVSSFWDNITKWFIELNINIDLTYFEICLGPSKAEKNIFINMIILLAKRYIYRCRVQELNLNFSDFKEWVLFIEKVEKYIAVSKDKYGVHVRKWEPMYLI
jgi:hypothetical protein